MATKKRLIDADLLDGILKDFESRYQKANFAFSAKAIANARQIVYAMKTVDAVEVVHARWVSDEGDVLFHCSKCETQISTSWDYDDLYWNYCPECGAKMDGGRNDD